MFLFLSFVGKKSTLLIHVSSIFIFCMTRRFEISRKHWNLLILCHFDEILKTNKPCMLLLDSLGKMGPGRLEPDIRRFSFYILNMSL